MRGRSVFISLLLGLSLMLCSNAFAGGTVGFNVKWYSTRGFPFDDIVDGDCEVTTSVAIADFNRDGIPDVAYSYPTCSGSGGVIAKLGTGGGNLGADIFTDWGAQTITELQTADINGDGRLDLMTRDSQGGCLTFVQGNGDGTFTPISGVACTGGYVASFTLGDFNHDGKIDLADIACEQENAGYPFGFANCTLHAYLGDGTGGFIESQTIQLVQGQPAYNLQSADINGDGNLDLIFVRDSRAVIRWGLGHGTFSSQIYLTPPTSDPMNSAAVADFNNDGRLDVALLSGNSCRPDPDTKGCDGANPNTVWMYKNNGGTSFTLQSHAQFTAQAGVIIPADINGDLNQDLLHYNPFADGIYPVLSRAGGFAYALGLGKDNLGKEGALPGGPVSAVAFRDMDGDSRADFAFIDWDQGLAVGIQSGGYKNCAPPNSKNLAAKICEISNGATVTSPLLVKASGNSPAGVNQLQVWIDGKKQYVKWGDQLSKKFTLSKGKHRIGVAANDKYIGTAKAAINVTVQ